METKKIAYTALGMLVGGILVVGAGVYASSEKSIGLHGIGIRGGEGFEKVGPRGESAFAKLITKSVVNTASGVELTLTTTDSGALAHIQKITEVIKNKKPLDQAKVSLTAIILDNGVKITITGTDADSIKRIQNEAANSKGIFPMKAKFNRPSPGDIASRIAFEKLITKSIVNTASGVETTLTTTDSGALVRLQNMTDMMTNRPHPDAEKINITSVKIDNGIKITVSSSDADIIKKIQDNAANKKGIFPMGGGFGGKGGMMKGGKGGGMMRNFDDANR